MKLLNNKTALITGASRGIGEAIALKFAEHGANIAFTFISEKSIDKAIRLEKKLILMGVKAKAYQTNASVFAACETMVNDVLKTFGNIDICVNNAGISKDNLLLRMGVEQWDEVITTNLNSVFYTTKLVMRPMMKAKTGTIINMSSIIGERGNMGQSSYAASKAGIIGFTKSMAKELGRKNIRCNAIAPGFVETDMTNYLKKDGTAENYKKNIPLGRFATAEDVANSALFLASDLSGYITGQTISICGGLNI